MNRMTVKLSIELEYVVYGRGGLKTVITLCDFIVCSKLSFPAPEGKDQVAMVRLHDAKDWIVDRKWDDSIIEDLLCTCKIDGEDVVIPSSWIGGVFVEE